MRVQGQPNEANYKKRKGMDIGLAGGPWLAIIIGPMSDEQREGNESVSAGRAIMKMC